MLKWLNISILKVTEFDSSKLTKTQKERLTLKKAPDALKHAKRREFLAQKCYYWQKSQKLTVKDRKRPKTFAIVRPKLTT